MLHADHRAHEVALLAPQLQNASPMRLGYRVASKTHIEEHAPVFEHRCPWMFDKVRFNACSECCRKNRISSRIGGASGHRSLPTHPLTQAGNVCRVMA